MSWKVTFSETTHTLIWVLGVNWCGDQAALRKRLVKQPPAGGSYMWDPASQANVWIDIYMVTLNMMDKQLTPVPTPEIEEMPETQVAAPETPEMQAAATQTEEMPEMQAAAPELEKMPEMQAAAPETEKMPEMQAAAPVLDKTPENIVVGADEQVGSAVEVGHTSLC